MYTASIYFLGQYRPAYFEADCPHKALAAAARAIHHCQDSQWFLLRLNQGHKEICRGNAVSWSADHGCRGVSFVAREHDPWLDSVTRKLPAYPGLDYTGAANV